MIHGHIKLFIDFARVNPRDGDKTLDQEIIEASSKFGKKDHKKSSAFCRILWAIHKAYDYVDDDVGRLILSYPFLA